MSKLMWVLGILLAAFGVGLALVGLSNPAQMQLNGISMDTAAILAVGGILSIGLGGVIAALGEPQAHAPRIIKDTPIPVADEPAEAAVSTAAISADAPVSPAPAEEASPSRIRFKGFGRPAADAAATVATTAAAATAAAATAAAAPVRSSVQDTIDALEKAKTELTTAVGSVATVAGEDADEPATTATTAAAVEEEDAGFGEDGDLYVLEERVIRGRPARILSDNTVEAETDEGWMRFENLEHLNEYLDAAGEQA